MSGIHDAWGLRAAFVAMAGLAGAALQLQQAVLWPPGAYVATLAFAATGLVAALLTARHRTIVLGAVVGLALFSATGLRAGLRLAEQLPAAL